MTVFTHSLSQDLQRLSGASHAFVRQVYSPEGAEARDIIERAVAEAPPWLAERAAPSGPARGYGAAAPMAAR